MRAGTSTAGLRRRLPEMRTGLSRGGLVDRLRALRRLRFLLRAGVLQGHAGATLAEGVCNLAQGRGCRLQPAPPASGDVQHDLASLRTMTVNLPPSLSRAGSNTVKEGRSVLSARVSRCN